MKRKIGERRATKYFWAACSPFETARTYLCSKAWKHYPGNSMACFQIWHHKWENGKKRPHPRCCRDIQNRAAGSGSGENTARKRKRQRSTSNADEGDEEDQDNAAPRNGNGSGGEEAEDSGSE
ncbi:hypothetical protein JG688_00011394 [Phytophthora aleatoria]|uniref:Uncharacterized protein n=1 Tax=Phytophthora aleatoria TaxID=2496075 RepID=A0A8J5IM43_9STRA|nr:hypothetical protein JG688_00011394 [Phytophthora aleatoria]